MEGYPGPKEVIMLGGPLDGRVFRHPLAPASLTDAEDGSLLDDGTLTYRALDRDDDNLELDSEGRLVLHYQGLTQYQIPEL